MPTLATVGFIAVLGVVCVTDLRRRRIPNLATGAAAAIGLFGILATDPEGLPVALLASLTVALPLLLASLVRPEGMGMGDVKLMAVIGLYLGWAAVPVLLAGLLAATVCGTALAIFQRRPLGELTLPLAPYLCVAALVPLINIL